MLAKSAQIGLPAIQAPFHEPVMVISTLLDNPHAQLVSAYASPTVPNPNDAGQAQRTKRGETYRHKQLQVDLFPIRVFLLFRIIVHLELHRLLDSIAEVDDSDTIIDSELAHNFAQSGLGVEVAGVPKAHDVRFGGFDVFEELFKRESTYASAAAPDCPCQVIAG
jgi:hypothetical protein